MKTQPLFAVVKVPAIQANPVRTSSRPVGLAGRRQIATSPLKTKLRPAVRAIAPVATLLSV